MEKALIAILLPITPKLVFLQLQIKFLPLISKFSLFNISMNWQNTKPLAFAKKQITRGTQNKHIQIW